MPARCFLVRHGQTDWNLEQRIQGQSDLPLNAAGLRQAEELAGYFASRPLTALYASHLQRSRQTAEAIARETGLEIMVDPDLAEIYLGEWEGLTAQEVDGRYQGAYRLWQSSPSQVRIPGAEPLTRFRIRARAAFSRIVDRHPDGRVAIVTHGGVIASLLSDSLDADYDALLRRLSLDNAGVSAVEHAVRPPQILWINETGHLGPSREPSAGLTHLIMAGASGLGTERPVAREVRSGRR